jgi:hypothetical protein
MLRAAFFVSPHGFGHAARAAAVAEALVARQPRLHPHFFTTVPRWFFDESLGPDFGYHRCECDVGLVQATPLVEDPAATIARLEASPWSSPAAVDDVAEQLSGLGCALVVADISPLGLRAAARAGLPSVLVANFTWDWIYERLPEAPEALVSLGREMAEEFAAAALRIDAEPCCAPAPGAVPVAPVARTPRSSRAAVRSELEIPDHAPLVLASMGGIRFRYGRLDHPADATGGAWVVVPGGAESLRRRGRLVLLPFHSRHYHPDLVGAADVVVGKLGYSTVAEACHAGTAMAYVARPSFPESTVLAQFVERHLNACELDGEAFQRGDWLPVIEQLAARPRRSPALGDGAAAAAAAIEARFPEVFGSA